MLIPADPADDKDIIVEIRAGAGGDEAALFAGDLFKMYERFAAEQGWKTETLDVSASEAGGFKEKRARLCDWLRWQKERFLEFLDYAAEHGGEALTRMFIDEMFVTERRVKKEGRGAGGMRPLRMWRGD